MKATIRARGSTLRFAAGIIAAVVLITGLTLAFITANLKAQTKARRERLHRAGIPMTLAEMTPPAIPENENAAPLYQQAIGHLAGAHIVAVRLAMEHFAHRNGPSRRAQLRAQVTAIVIQNQRALDRFREGARRPHCRFPLDWNVANPSDFFHQQPDWVPDGAYQLLARAVIRMERGDAAGAIADARGGLRISSHMAEGSLGGTAVSSTLLRATALDVLQELIESERLDPATCRQLFDDLEEPDLQALFRRELVVGHVLAIWAFDTAQRDPAAMRYELKTERIDVRTFTAGYLSPLGSLMRLREEVSYLDRIERGLALYKLPYRRAARGHQALEGELGRDRWYHRLTTIFTPVDIGSGMPMRRDRLLARQGGIQVALALKAYHSKYGRYPGSLDALRAYPGGAWAAPEMRRSRIQGWKLPDDPFGGKAFGYRREGKGFMLYSWGPDLKDDGGYPGHYPAWAYFSTPPPSGDIVWHYRR